MTIKNERKGLTKCCLMKFPNGDNFRTLDLKFLRSFLTCCSFL